MQHELRSPRASQLEGVVARLTKEDINAERRSLHRTVFVRPVTVKITGDNERRIIGFSKNISPMGIGLIMEEAIPEGTVGTITIHTTSNRLVHIRSELRWCRPFGNDWSITGWNFIAEVRG